MSSSRKLIEHAIEAFVGGFCHGKSATHPYEAVRIGPAWVMRDTPRKNPRLYRKEEWVVHGGEPAEIDALAREHTRGRFFICPVIAAHQSEDQLTAYKQLGYRLMAREGMFVHDLARISRTSGPIPVTRLRTIDLATKLGQATRSRPLREHDLAADAPIRQYVAVDGEALVGWVRSTVVGPSTWCSHMYVRPSHRRRGIGRALLAKMLRDDRSHGANRSVLLASKAGALLYPQVGYEQIATLLILVPPHGARQAKSTET